MAGADCTLRVAAEADLAAIAAIHLTAYSRRHFTSRLSRATLIDYYRLFLADGAQTLVLAQPAENGTEEILGFAVFGRGIGAKIAQFKKHNRFDILKTSAIHPFAAGGKILQRLWTRVTQGRPMEAAEYLLLSIAVAQPGTGAGGVLLDAFLERAAGSGAERVGLYVNADNVAAINAYVNRGFIFRQLYGGQFYMDRLV